MNIKGIINITGEHDSGKTLAALGLAHPKKTAFIHDDVKLPPIDQGEFGLWLNLAELELPMLKMKDHVLSEVSKIKPGQYDAIVFDTWSRLGTALRSYGKLNANKTRERETMSAGSTYLYGQQWAEGHLYEAGIVAKLASLSPLVIITSHLSDHYEGGAKTGKQVPNLGKSFDRICNLRLWLRLNPASGVPIALVLKRISKTTVTKNGIEAVNVLPRKITPLPEEKSIWQAVERYWKEPFGNREPVEGEEPDEYELSILDGILTSDQKEVWRANLKEKEREEAEQLAIEDEAILGLVQQMNGASFPEIQETVKNSFGRELSIGEIMEMRKNQ